MKQNPSNWLFKIPDGAIEFIVFPSILPMIQSFYDEGKVRLATKIKFLTYVHLIFNCEAAANEANFWQMLGDVTLEFLKRTLSRKGFLIVIDSLPLTDDLIETIVCGFDFSIGYVLLISDQRFLFTHKLGEYRLYNFSIIQFISQIRSEGKLGPPINNSYLKVDEATNAVQFIFEHNNMNLMQVPQLADDKDFLEEAEIIGDQTIIDHLSNVNPPDVSSTNSLTFPINDQDVIKLEQFQDFKTNIENQTKDLVEALQKQLKNQFDMIGLSYPHRHPQMNNSEMLDLHQ
jgi:hypothetical protein